MYILDIALAVFIGGLGIGFCLIMIAGAILMLKD